MHLDLRLMKRLKHRPPKIANRRQSSLSIQEKTSVDTDRCLAYPLKIINKICSENKLTQTQRRLR